MLDLRTFYIVDDHPLMRDALRIALKNISSEASILGESGCVEQASNDIPKLKPQMVILDHGLNSGTGIDLLKLLKPQSKDVRFVLLTQFGKNEILSQYRELDIDGIILKENSVEEIHRALSDISKGLKYYCASTQKVFAEPRPWEDLTQREIEVVKLMTEGKSNKEIGTALGCSDQTVKTHKSNLMRKLNLSNSVEVSMWALKNGIV